MARRKGFTLIEILLVAGLVGIIAAAALAPLVFVVGSLEDAQKRWGNSHNTESAADKITADVRRAIKTDSFSSCRIIHKSGLSQANDDRLLVWCDGPQPRAKKAEDNKEQKAESATLPGVVVYKAITEDKLRGTKQGIYRWKITENEGSASEDVVETSSGDKVTTDVSSPMDIDTDALDVKQADCLVSDLDGIRFCIKDGKEWKSEDYEGDVPKYMSVEFYNGEKMILKRSERFPNGEK